MRLDRVFFSHSRGLMSWHFTGAIGCFQRLRFVLLHTVQYPRYCTGNESQIFLIRASAVGFPYAKCILHLAYKPKKWPYGKSIFFFFFLRFSYSTISMEKKSNFLMLFLTGNFSLLSHFFSFFSLSSFSVSHPLSLSPLSSFSLGAHAESPSQIGAHAGSDF